MLEQQRSPSGSVDRFSFKLSITVTNKPLRDSVKQALRTIIITIRW